MEDQGRGLYERRGRCIGFKTTLGLWYYRSTGYLARRLPVYGDLFRGTRRSYYQFGDQFVPIARPDGYNPNLKWEETTTWNAGFDFGFLDNRITSSLDYYYRETKDLINVIDVPAGTNFKNRIVSNIGSLRNQGVEFSIKLKRSQPLIGNGT